MPTGHRTSFPSATPSTTTTLYFVADAKPKRRPARELVRLRNLRANPRAAVVVDDWAEDWTRLAFVLVRGPAREITDPLAHAAALRLLRTRYPQYAAMPLDDVIEHPVIGIAARARRAVARDARADIVRRCRLSARMQRRPGTNDTPRLP